MPMELEAEPLPEPLQEPSLEPTVPPPEETVSPWRRVSERREGEAFRDTVCHGVLDLLGTSSIERDGRPSRDKATSVRRDPHKEIRTGH